MTNAEKFKEVFGFDLAYEHGLCNMESCDICPFAKSVAGECSSKAYKFWNEKYEESDNNDKQS